MSIKQCEQRVDEWMNNKENASQTSVPRIQRREKEN